MKKMTFEPVVIEYIRFQTADIITTSAGMEDGWAKSSPELQEAPNGAFTTGGEDLTVW